MKKQCLAALLSVSLMASALPVMAAEQTYTATPSQNPLYVGERLVEDIPVYTLSDNNYFRLRDIAMLMDFAVEWDAQENCVKIHTDQSYGSAEDGLGAATQNKTAVPSSQKVYIDGTLAEDLTAYSIDNYNYFRLRDLAQAADFGCVYDAGKNAVVLDAGYGYQPDNTFGPSKETQPEQAEMTLNTNLLAIDVGSVYQLKVSGAPGIVQWKTKDRTVATVDNDGVVTGISAGNTTVYAVSGEQLAACEVVVLEPEQEPEKEPDEVVQMTLDATELTMQVGDVKQLQVNVEGATWSSSDSQVATVEQGAVTAVGAGTATVTAQYGDVQVACTVTVSQPQQQTQITEEQVYESIIALKSEYPEGMTWTNDNGYFSDPLNTMGYGCHGFALICSDTAFGTLPSTIHEDFDAIRVGDIIRIGNYHTVVALEKKADSIIVTEGNYNSSIHWGREITRDSLNQTGFYVQTRYPA